MRRTVTELRGLRAVLAERQVGLDDALQLAVDHVTDAMQADRGTLYLVDHARAELVSRAAILPEIREIRLRLGEGVAGHVAATGAVLNVPLGTDDPRFAERIDALTGYRTRSLLAAPVVDEAGEVIGVLQVLNHRSGEGFARTLEPRLVTLAAEVAALLQVSSLASQLRPGQVHALDFHYNGIVGSSPAMREVYRRIDLAAPTDTTVLVRGETGTGKELVARALHDNSDRADAPFVKVDCAALPESLIENELFGHERGAFTGADRAAPGKVAAADGGTLFLDEIGELPLNVQGRLLRLLQDRSYLPVGAQRARSVDVRFVAATHRDLEALVAAGRFRQDLYFRLKVVEVRLPALRSRGAADLDQLAAYVVHRLIGRLDRPELHLTEAAIRALHSHSWPGNVRELKHVLEAAAVLSGGSAIRPDHLGLSGSVLKPSEDAGFRAELGTLANLERAYVRWALDQHGGNKAATARALDIGRNTLARKLDEG